MENIINMNMNNKTNIIPGKEECEICAEVINKSTHKKITCPFEVCSQSCCSKCFSRFLMDSGLSSVCMWCKKDLSFEFIEDNTTKKFYKEYLDHRAGIHVDRAKGELPLLQEEADRILRSRKYKKEKEIVKKHLITINEKINMANFELSSMWDLFGITGKNQYKQYIMKVDNCETILNDKNMCSLCMNRNCTYTCDKCNLKNCEQCLKLCLLVNNTNCVRCDETKITLEFIQQKLTMVYYNKFFKPKNRRQNKPEMLEVRKKTIETIRKKLSVNEEIYSLCYDLYKTKEGFNFNENRNTVTSTKEEKKFIKKCPDSVCRGFLSSAWKCGICNEFFCPDCHVKKNSRIDEEHICDESEKATVALLKTDSKPCPGCNSMIHRYTGCSQVWSPCCKIAFDWNTGKIVGKGERIHSPEYYDYMRRVNNGIVPREVDDNPCGGIVNHWEMRTLFQFNRELQRYHQLMEHVNNFIIPELPRTIGDFERNDLGVSYLISDIDEIKWKIILKKRIKKDEKNNHIFHILNMFVNVINDFFRNLLTDRNFELYFENANQLITYTNEQISKINRRYSSVCQEFFVVLR